MDNLNIINENLNELIFDGEPLFDEDIYLENILCDTILSSRYPKDENLRNDEQVYKCKNKISLEHSIEICKKFLNSINPKYVIVFDSLINNNIFQFIKTDDIYQNSSADFTDEEAIIKVYLLGNINDVFTIIHEFMHYTNSRYELATEVTSYYTGAFSNFIELLMTDYIIENYPKYKKDALKIKRSIFVSIYEKNIETKVVIELIKKKNNGIIISSYQIFDLIKDINFFCPDLELIKTALEQTADTLVEDAEGAYLLNVRDTLGIVLGCYMYELSKNKNSFKEIFELNDNLNNFYYDEVLTYLDLEMSEDFTLTDESSKKLIKSYKNQIKNLW